MLRLEERVENLEEGQKRIETKLDKIMNTLDAFVGRVDNLTNDSEIVTHHTYELRLQVGDHEKRLKNLEPSK